MNQSPIGAFLAPSPFSVFLYFDSLAIICSLENCRKSEFSAGYRLGKWKNNRSSNDKPDQRPAVEAYRFLVYGNDFNKEECEKPIELFSVKLMAGPKYAGTHQIIEHKIKERIE